MATDREKEDLRLKLIKSFESLIDLIRKFLKEKQIEDISELTETVLINKLKGHIEFFQINKITGLQIFIKHIKKGFTPPKRDADRFIKQIEELTEIFDPSKGKKIKRIIDVIMQITENMIKSSYEDWASSQTKNIIEFSKRIQRVMEYMANLGDLDGIYNYYSNLIKDFDGTKLGQLLDTNGKNLFKTEFEKIQDIYSMK